MTNIAQLQTGKVKWVNEEKGFGFIAREGQADIFFHIKGGRKSCAPGTRTPILGLEGVEKMPKKGTKMVFYASKNQKGEVARPWITAEVWEEAAAKIKKAPIYRLGKTYTTGGGGQEDEKVLWEGSDLREPGMETHFNPIYDRLTGTGGDLDWAFQWYVSEDGGNNWVECDTPEEYRNQFNGRGQRKIKR